MIKSLLPFYSIVFFIYVGCKKSISPMPNKEKVVIPLDSLSKEKVKVDLVKLLPETLKKLEDFEDFQNLKNIIQSMHASNPFYIKRYADSIDQLVINFNENISKELKINTISSRIVVLQTETGLLLELSKKENPDSQKLTDANMRLLTAYNSLVIQLNELFLAIPDNIGKELLKEQMLLRDSIINPDEKK